MGVYGYLMGVPCSQITPEEAQKNREYNKYMMDRREYEEHYGEHVGYCSVHKHDVLDSYCEDCGDDIPYEEYVSECCSAFPIGELDISTVPYGGPSGFCGNCKDNTIFERP